jgi:hypothetical protein
MKKRKTYLRKKRKSYQKKNRKSYQRKKFQTNQSGTKEKLCKLRSVLL